MVQGRRKIIWSIIARTSRNSIFSYWNNRNKSNLCSKKIFILFNETLERIAQFPETSLSTNSSKIRYVLVRDYYLIFETTEFTIKVLDIWDTRQNPENFPLK
jgi:toxin YoeB